LSVAVVRAVSRVGVLSLALNEREERTSFPELHREVSVGRSLMQPAAIILGAEVMALLLSSE